MQRRLVRTVIVRNERHEVVAFGPNDDVPGWAAAQITNPVAWGVDDEHGVDKVEPAVELEAPSAALVEVEDPVVEVLDPPSVVAAEPLPAPAKSGSKAAWLAHAISRGADADAAASMTRDELADRYGDS